MIGGLDLNEVYCMDCLVGLKKISSSSVDLIVTDPPYLIKNTNAGGGSKLSKSIQNMNNEIKHANLINGFNKEILNEMVRVCKKINIYIWCNHKQILDYLKFFIDKHKCCFDILVWQKTNAMPLFNNKYLTDKEYCIYFRKEAYCKPPSYRYAKTIFKQPINILDKNKFSHPTIKPLKIIKNLIINSSKESEIILDPFMGSGTTAVACKQLNRKYIGFEIEQKYVDICKRRLSEGNLKNWF